MERRKKRARMNGENRKKTRVKKSFRLPDKLHVGNPVASMTNAGGMDETPPSQPAPPHSLG
ncbi:UvrABC system protein B, partial [Clarias magur]